MSFVRWISLGALLAVAGCDVGVAAILAMRDDGGGSDDAAPPLVVSAPEPKFSVAVAWLPDDAAADAAHTALVGSGGNPTAPTWTEIGSDLATAEFDPLNDPASINTILIKTTSTQNFQLDSLEVLDDQGNVVGHPSDSVWSDRVVGENNLLGTPDGAGAVTVAVAGANAFIFTRYTGPIDKIRVNACAVGWAPGSGDVVAVGGYGSSYSEKPGGMAIDSNGFIHLTLTVNTSGRLVRYGPDAAYLGEAQIDSNVEPTYGSHCVALNSSGQIFTAACKADGKVVVKAFDQNLNSDWNRTLYSGKNNDRVEANGIAVDESGDVVVAGAMNTSSQGLNHWLAKLSGTNGNTVFDFRPGGDTADTYWRGVTTGPGNLIYTTGNHTSGLFGVVQILTGRFDSSGTGEWEHMFGDSDAPDDAGNAIALDASGNKFVAGFAGTAAEGRNAVLLRYSSTGILYNYVAFNGASNGDDEILDIVVDPDGSIYAVGYETVAGQGKNIWVRKYDANFNPVWTRTHDGGVGDDVATSAAIHGDQLVVAGYETVAGGATKFKLRVYTK